ncbi:PorP/SprF family type IX secretion system membrane protein [Ekhidna sp.]
MRRLIIFTFSCLVAILGFSQLDPLYSQYQFNQQMINPAYTGIYSGMSATLISRVQWLGVDGAPTTNTLLGQSTFKEGAIGIGGMVVDDRLGVNQNMEGIVSLSYNIRFNDSKLAMGMQGGFTHFGYDLSNLNLDFVDDERLNTGIEEFTESNFGAGLMYMKPTYYVGVSVPRIRGIETNDGVANSTRYKRHYYLSAGYFYEASEFLQYKLTTLVRYVESEKPSIDVVFSGFIDKFIWTGLTVRDLSNFGIFTNIELGKNLRLGYSFELPTNSLLIANYGTHEISISIDKSFERGRIKSYHRRF